jgi:two-component system, NtrC family, response regulator AtoC
MAGVGNCHVILAAYKGLAACCTWPVTATRAGFCWQEQTEELMNRAARILVVDDAQSFRFLIQGYLDDAGYQSVSVSGGLEALMALEQSRYDLILSDMIMPGMDGLALLQQVRLRHPQLPFVLVTAHGSIDNAVATMKCGADDYLQKPLNRQELLAVVQRLLEHARLKIHYGLMPAGERGSVSGQIGVGELGSAPYAAQPVAAQPLAAAPPAAGALGKDGGNNFVAFKPYTLPEPLPQNELFSDEIGAFIGPDPVRGELCGQTDGGSFSPDRFEAMPSPFSGPRTLELSYDSGTDQAFSATVSGVPPAQDQGDGWGPATSRCDLLPYQIGAGISRLRECGEAHSQLAEQLERFRQHEGKTLPGLQDPIFRTKA